MRLPRTSSREVHCERSGWRLEIVEDAPLSRVIARIPEARRLEPDAFSSAVCEAYTSVEHLLSSRDDHPIRYWNFLPGIGDRFGAVDRYMLFNRGRFDAFTRADRLRPSGATLLPTSSAIGVDAEDFTIECVATNAPGIPVENPRQISSWNYSRSYGPRPPCFARATIAPIDGALWLLIGGTASVVGEASYHERDLQAQLEETFANLDALIAAAHSALGSDPNRAQFADARVYVSHLEDADAVAAGVQARLRDVDPLEIALAVVCRQELLVEIEGRVRLTPSRG